MTNVKTNPLPSQQYLLECFDYGPDKGKLVWKERPLSHFTNESRWKAFNSHCAGEEAGTPNTHGHLQVVVNGVRYYVHRIVWKLVTGVDPKETIDHISRNPLDNRIANLREACVIVQGNNKSNNNDLPRGVQKINSKINPYQVNVCNEYLGCYPTIEEASLVAEAGYEYIAMQKAILG